MQELLESLRKDFDDAEGWLRIVAADWSEDDLKLTLSVKYFDERDVELWEISCSGVVEESLSSHEADTLAVSADSALLKPFVEHQVPLMFSENAMTPEALFGIVCSCCIDIMLKPESISRFMNMAPAISGMASAKFGLLGTFPESLAARILDALDGKPISIKALPGYAPTWWNGSTHIAYGQLHALQLGDSYVIAHQFSAMRA